MCYRDKGECTCVLYTREGAAWGWICVAVVQSASRTLPLSHSLLSWQCCPSGLGAMAYWPLRLGCLIQLSTRGEWQIHSLACLWRGRHVADIVWYGLPLGWAAQHCVCYAADVWGGHSLGQGTLAVWWSSRAASCWAASGASASQTRMYGQGWVYVCAPVCGGVCHKGKCGDAGSTASAAILVFACVGIEALVLAVAWVHCAAVRVLGLPPFSRCCPPRHRCFCKTHGLLSHVME